MQQVTADNEERLLFRRTGQMAIGSRLRMMTERITADAASIYALYDTYLQPAWFPVFFILQDGRPHAHSDISVQTGLADGQVRTILDEMAEERLVDDKDGVATLTRQGSHLTGVLNLQYADVAQAIGELGQESHVNLWAALREWERLLNERSLLRRVADIKERRERSEVQIVPFVDAQHHDAFRDLNVEWIQDLFGQVEPTDHYELDHPVENILARGGHIFIALLRGKPVGSFALMPCKLPQYDLELVKFAVSPSAQGHGIGRRLIEACLAQARLDGCFRLFLESNYKCAAAVHLYEKYGFRHLPVEHSDYVRCDVQMELILK